MLLLNNEDIESILPVDACLGILEDSYRDLGNRKAATVPRYDVLSPNSEDRFYEYKTMSGVFPREKVAALRLNSSVVHWYEKAGKVRKDKLPLAGGDRYVGLVLLFSTETGEPLAIFPDGFVQKMRVAGTDAIAARYLARRESKTMALLGTGWQGSAHLVTCCSVFDLETVKVFSPTPENRARFTAEMQGQVSPRLEEADTVEAALDGADVVICATNALSPLFPGGMLEPGSHVSCVKPCELDDEAYQRARPLVIHWREAKPIYNVLEVAPDTIPDVVDGFRHPLSREVVDQWDDLPTLSQLVNGEIPGRQDAEAITCFCNNVGIGLQFAAVGVEVLRRAREARVGRELPTDWFLESVHP